jgi:hypothetical protein
MRKNALVLATLAIFAMAVALSVAAQDMAKVDGDWQMSMEGPNGTMTQTLTFHQDGAKLTGTSKGQRGESPLEGTVDGNKIHFTVTRHTPNGDRQIEYDGVVDGDTIKGKVKFGQNERDWTAKRGAAASAPAQ